jgi:hypothetical protein
LSNKLLSGITLNMETGTKDLRGRPPIAPGARRELRYVFRVSTWEREWLDSIGTPVFWRTFDLLCAKVLKGEMEPVTLEGLVNMAQETMDVNEQD